MTLVASPEIITIEDIAYPAIELPLAPEAVLAAEFAGDLVIAQQVDMDGKPFTIPEPGKWRPDMSPDAWDIYIKQLKVLRESGTLRRVTMPPYLGTVRSLGEQAAYFALRPVATNTTAIIPFHAVRDPEGNESSRYRLYAVR